VAVLPICVANHAFLAILLQFTGSNGLGEAAKDNGFEVGELLEATEEGVISLFMAGQIGEPSVPHTSALRFDLWHDSCFAGKLRKVELIHKAILVGRGAM
jgi:hypothetical protein